MEEAAGAAGAEFATTWISAGPLGGGHPPFDAPAGGELRSGDLVIAGVQLIRDNHWGHAIRAGVVGDPSDEQRRLYGVVDDAREAVLDRARPGVELSELHSAVQSVYREAGHGNSFRSLHGLGLQYGGPPEFPQPGSEPDPSALSTELEPGMVFEIHPNVWGGSDGDRFAAVGDAVAITERGARRLTNADRELYRY